MTAQVTPHVLDFGLAVFEEAAHLYFCTAEPTDFGAVTASAIGTVALNPGFFSAPMDGSLPRSRKVTSGWTAVTVGVGGTVGFYAVADNVDRLLVTGEVTANSLALQADTVLSVAPIVIEIAV